MPITYKRGDCLNHRDARGRDVVIPHVNNNRCGWGAGFVLALSKKWPEPEAVYRSKNVHNLGEVTFVQVEESNGERVFVANMIAQNGYKSAENPVPLDYNALEICLKEIANKVDPEYTVIAAPKFGSGLGGGDWSRIEGIINDTLYDFEVTIYEL